MPCLPPNPRSSPGGRVCSRQSRRSRAPIRPGASWPRRSRCTGCRDRSTSERSSRWAAASSSPRRSAHWVTATTGPNAASGPDGTSEACAIDSGKAPRRDAWLPIAVALDLPARRRPASERYSDASDAVLARAPGGSGSIRRWLRPAAWPPLPVAALTCSRVAGGSSRSRYAPCPRTLAERRGTSDASLA